MRAEVEFRPQAEDDLQALFEYLLAESSARIAGDYTRRVHAACLALAEYPARHSLHPELGDGIRLLGFEKRVAVAYRIEDSHVVIYGIFYGGRDAVLEMQRRA